MELFLALREILISNSFLLQKHLQEFIDLKDEPVACMFLEDKNENSRRLEKLRL